MTDCEVQTQRVPRDVLVLDLLLVDIKDGKPVCVLD